MKKELSRHSRELAGLSLVCCKAGQGGLSFLMVDL
jgi:hypothetical protein